MAILRVNKDVSVQSVKLGLGILRVSKDERVQRVNWDVAILRVSKNVRVQWDVAIVSVRKDVTLLREWGTCLYWGKRATWLCCGKG